MKMPSRSDVRDFLVGIDYDSIEEDKGHFVIYRKVTMPELIEELQGFIKEGHHFPQFPARANPTVTYAFDLNNQEDADIYGEIVNELEKINQKEKLNNV
jgi:hypothetical protein